MASHAGWQDPKTWESFARSELELMLLGLGSDVLADSQVMEIGCGSGRLAYYLAPMVAGYTGFDIASGMVDAAEERCRELTNARFLVSNGLAAPEEAMDRRYDLILSVAVFIHCPKQVIECLVRSAFAQLRPLGQLRFQVLADPCDPTGVANADQNQVVQAHVQAVVDERTAEETELSSDAHYMGHPFRYAEVQEFFGEVAPGKLDLYRGHLGAIYGAVCKAG